MWKKISVSRRYGEEEKIGPGEVNRLQMTFSRSFQKRQFMKSVRIGGELRYGVGRDTGKIHSKEDVGRRKAGQEMVKGCHNVGLSSGRMEDSG